MFGYSVGRAAYPTIYSQASVKKNPKRDTPQSQPELEVDSTASLEPAIDGPPSPERIRAYTEQMKRSSIFGNNSRTNTFSSATSSFRSRESVSASTDSLSLSRKSSSRSNTGRMPSSRSDRPESVQIFGSIFSRGGKKGKKDANARTSTITRGGVIEEESAVDRYYGKSNSRRGTMYSTSRRHLISEPYNFQHLTHTRQDHLPNLEQSTRTELVSEFSAIRASQVPTRGELKGIRAQDLHFENFSSEALNAPSSEEHNQPPTSPNSSRRHVLRKSTIPPALQLLGMLHARSQDNLRGPPPPRPPRSPLSPSCPVSLPARTSSRTASVLFETFDPRASASIEQSQTDVGFGPPAPFGLPTPPAPPQQQTFQESQQYFSERPMSHAVTTPGDEAWPLTSQTPGNYGAELADVQEEEEEMGSKPRLSRTSSELRVSQSVPMLRVKSYEQEESTERPDRFSTTLGGNPHARPSVLGPGPRSPGFQFIRDSWEDDVDFCYENEIEADCDYQWDRCSADDTPAEESPPAVQPQLELHLEDDDRSVYHGRFRPSLLVPSALDLPELSPISNTSTPSDPRTPSNFLRPGHARSPSHASSFKESHGFTLSPTLLIPTDFQSHMDQESIYDDHFNNQSTSATIFPQETFAHAMSPVDESTSSTASYRSSNFSRGSARSSSSTRISTANSRGSRDSIDLLNRATGISQAHRSIGSASSLPDLISSTLRKPESIYDSDLQASLSSLDVSEDDSAPAPQIAGTAHTLASVQHRRNKSLVGEPGLRKGVNHFSPAPSATVLQVDSVDVKGLSPVAESFIEAPKEAKAQALVHGRKSSAPLVGASAREFKGRQRAATLGSAGHMAGGKKRGSYMLFPQT